MVIYFVDGRDEFIFIYLDDMTIFSKSNEHHLKHLTQVFKKCQKYGLSLNPKKYCFAMIEGKLLGHKVSQHGVRIDPKRVEAIQTIKLPRIKKQIQSFFIKVIFLRRFIPNFAEIVKEITLLLRKEQDIKWTSSTKETFQRIKTALLEPLVLVSPNYRKYFMLFPFSSKYTITTVLLHKNGQCHDKPIAFFSHVLRDNELKDY